MEPFAGQRPLNAHPMGQPAAALPVQGLEPELEIEPIEPIKNRKDKEADELYARFVQGATSPRPTLIITPSPTALQTGGESVPHFLGTIVAGFSTDAQFFAKWQSVVKRFLNNPKEFDGQSANVSGRLAPALLSTLSLLYCHENRDQMQQWLAADIEQEQLKTYGNLATFAASYVIGTNYRNHFANWISQLQKISPRFYQELESITSKLGTRKTSPSPKVDPEAQIKACIENLRMAPAILCELKNALDAGIAEDYLELNCHLPMLAEVLKLYTSPNRDLLCALLLSVVTP